MNLMKIRRLVRAEQRPIPIRLHTLHTANPLHQSNYLQPPLEKNSQEIRNPQRIEQIARADLFLAVVLAQVEEIKHVRVPRLDVDGECAGTLVAALVDVAGRAVVCAEHRYDTIAVAVRACNVRAVKSQSPLYGVGIWLVRTPLRGCSGC